MRKAIIVCFVLVIIIAGSIAVYMYHEKNEVDIETTSIESTKPQTITTNESVTETTSSETKKTISPNTETTTEDVREGKFKAICQYPELPTGCEITSLTMVLNHYKYNVDKGSLSDKYLNKGEVGKVDPRKQFEGDPRDGNSYGCYAPVIVDTANKYLSEYGSKKRAYDLTGTPLQNLFKYTENLIPVMTWCTYKLQPGHYSVTWNVDGKELTWYTPEHCMVLLGEEDGYVYMADPAYGKIKKYNRKLFEKRYNELFKQAVVIK